ncbi:tetratricopeptide repeat protein [Trichlorobacter lovleyi]|uniref:tetratricopeptide repeat protein n=1 Tax=Trichlorobacter lovleyi TaxID=313985 RepID=UPI0022406EE9|nr:tetratricopeptide repeat protein [Trichlorobacter lovleyi]QOX78598.1 tetratricopeptide repeat protein [Trichlorobacter lovleyi]
MDDQQAEAAEREYQRACRALDSGNVLAALLLLEAALRQQDNLQWYAMLGYCVARERGQVARGTELCRSALERFPENPEHYYYYARLLLMAGQKAEAVQVLRQGLAHGESPAILNLLQELGTRKPPPIRWLHRNNPLNKYLGILLARTGLR